ncbi:MAG: hypothetical protein C5B54_00060 [Acidobacteria bacterium]|nr:MAG: hypothetical protein C5B54_00060 [Acidobacteriota bacterium]
MVGYIEEGDATLATQTIKIKRTVDPDKPPATLQDGELAIGMNDVPPRMWAGCDGVVKELFAGTAVEDAEDDAVYGRSDGEWVPVPIVSATVPINPAPNSFWFNTTDGTLQFLYDDGDSVQWVMIGPTLLDQNNSRSRRESESPIIVAATAPVSPRVNALWFDSVGGQLYLWFNDGVQNQWIAVISG